MRLSLSVLLSLLLASLSAYADSGRVQLSAVQSGMTAFGADGMLPLLGNNQQFFYADLMGDYGTDDTYLMSPGLGYRALVNNQIWGGYVFSDYERTGLGENFWVLSPGMEWISSYWDAHINGYFPAQSKQQDGNTDWADNYGVYEYGDPHGNQFDNAYLTPYAVVGNGVDTEVAYSFTQENKLRSRISLGGYYYHPQEAYDVSNITGITAGFTKSLSKNFSASFMNSYDNVNHYILGISLTLTLDSSGDSNEFSTNVADRFLDPIERHVGIIGTGAGTYDQQSYQVTGYGREYYPVEYVSPNGTGSGTAEDPAPLTQDSLNAFNEQFPNGASIFMQGGSGASYDLTSNLSLYSLQNIHGRTPNYTAPADADEQPQINAASGGWDVFDITDGVNTISDITINGQSDSLSGIYIIGNSRVTLSDVNISGFPDGSAGVFVYNTADLLELNITNSTFNNNGTGIHAENVGSGEMLIDISNSSVNYNLDNDLTLLNNVGSPGTGTAILTVNNSEFLNTGTTSGNDGIFLTNGSNGIVSATIENSIFLGNRSNGLEIYNNASQSQSEGDGTGAGKMSVSIKNARFSNNGHYPDGLGSGISVVNYGASTTNVSLSHATLSNNGKYGLSVNNAQVADGANSIMNINIVKSAFRNNDAGYAIFGTANAGTSTTIDYASTIFVGNTPTNQSSDDNITWIAE